MTLPSTPIRLAVLASGGGTTLQNLLDHIADGRLHAQVALVIASKPGIRVIERAERAGVPVEVVERKGLDRAGHGERIFEAIRKANVDLVVLGGFLHLLDIPDDFHLRVINIHPSLIPAFCGKGYHGHAVHQAAIDYGVKLAGCTVHYADATYDTGPILVQKAVPVLDGDDADSLAARVFQAECEALPEAIRLIAEGRIEVIGRRVRIKP